MLNSFWGKEGQQSNKSQVTSFTSAAEFYDLLNEDMIKVVYKFQGTCNPVQVNMIFMACFTTCWTRLGLYEEVLCKLGPQQTLYFDTDSLIKKQKGDEPTLPLGDFLGKFTKELNDPNDHIVKFASAGPKNYGYRTKYGKICSRVCRFSLKERGSEQLNFYILKQNVLDKLTDPLE